MKPQTALADAFDRAGFNTAEVRLRGLAIGALKKHHRNIPRALPTFEGVVEDDPELIREALLYYLCRIDADMSDGGHLVCDDHKARATDRDGAGQRSINPQSGYARPVREPSAIDRAAAANRAQSIVLTVFDRLKTSDGRPWGNVGAHELDGMARDGAVARAVKDKLGVLSNSQRFQTLRELLKPEDFESIHRAAREQSNGA